MAPENEDAYVTRLMTCHACAERSKRQVDLREAPSEHGMHVHVYRRHT